jgi:hypothetical protein
MRPHFPSSTRTGHLAPCERANARMAGCVRKNIHKSLPDLTNLMAGNCFLRIGLIADGTAGSEGVGKLMAIEDLFEGFAVEGGEAHRADRSGAIFRGVRGVRAIAARCSGGMTLIRWSFHWWATASFGALDSRSEVEEFD